MRPAARAVENRTLRENSHPNCKAPRKSAGRSSILSTAVQDELIDLREAMALLKCGRSKFYATFLDTGRLQRVRYGGRVFFRRLDVEVFLGGY